MAKQGRMLLARQTAGKTGWGGGKRTFCKKLKGGIGTANSGYKSYAPADAPAWERLSNCSRQGTGVPLRELGKLWDPRHQIPQDLLSLDLYAIVTMSR